ncbi:MAG: hypothetical protein JXB88_11945 [Spirochaetales bacterium]|nr:hypothetical protein [Spirochaetales bacterium]
MYHQERINKSNFGSGLFLAYDESKQSKNLAYVKFNANLKTKEWLENFSSLYIINIDYNNLAVKKEDIKYFIISEDKHCVTNYQVTITGHFNAVLLNKISVMFRIYSALFNFYFNQRQGPDCLVIGLKEKHFFIIKAIRDPDDSFNISEYQFYQFDTFYDPVFHNDFINLISEIEQETRNQGGV